MWSDNQILTAAALNGEFNNILTDYNGGITNANISASAAIAYSKLSLSGSIVNTDISASAKTGTGNIVLQTKPTFNGSVQAYTTDTDGATITFDMSASNIHTVTLGGNRTLATSGISAGQTFVIILQQDVTGSRTVTWWSGIKWAGAITPNLTIIASRWDIFSFIYDGTNYYGSIVGQSFG